MQEWIVTATAGLIAGALLTWLWTRYRSGTLQAQANALHNRSVELDRELTATRNELASARADANQSAQRATQAEAEHRAAIDRTRDLEERLKTGEARARTDTDALRSHVSGLQDTLKDAAQRFTQADTQRLSSQERAQDLDRRLNAAESQARIDITAVRTELSGAQQQLNDATQRLTQVTAERQAALDRAQEHADRLKQLEDDAATASQTHRTQLATAQTEVNRLDTAAKLSAARIQSLETDLQTTRDDLATARDTLSQKNEQLQTLAAANATLQADLRAASQTLSEQRDWIGAQSNNLKTAFAELANTVVTEKTAGFKAESQQSLQVLLTPLRDQMTAFQSRMDQIHTEDAKGRAGLEQVMQSMGRTHQLLAEQAHTLTEALTQKPKLQGDFGEMKLEAQLEAGGFKEGHHYLRQPTYRDDLDQSKRPDVVIRMPTRTGYLAVDAKVTLSSWIRVVSAASDEERDTSQAEVIRYMRDRIDELAARQYPALMDGEQPVPFTLMYVPIEGAALCALEYDPDLFAYAQKQKVIIASPSTLFVMVGIIHQLWRVADQERNAKDIADEGGKLIAKIENFLKSWQAVGKNLESAVTFFNQADKQLHTGKGNAMTILQRMVALGVQGREGGALERYVNKALDVTVVVQPELLPPPDLDDPLQESAGSDAGVV